MNTFTFKLKLSTIFSVAALIIFGLIGLSFSIQVLQNEVRLNNNHNQVQAVVTETRISHGRKNIADNFDLRYQFELPSSSDTYTRTDETGRQNLWSTLTKRQWDDARNTGTLAVIYFPNNPWINRPKQEKNSVSDDAIAGTIAIGGIPLLMAALIIWTAFVEHKKLIHMKKNGQMPQANLSWHKLQGPLE